MRATIDAGGRVVVPKEIRERLGLLPGSRVELTEAEGHLEIAPTPTSVTLIEQDGYLVAVSETALPPMSTDDVRAVVEGTRR